MCEKGIGKDGQIRQHVLLAFALGVQHVIIAVTGLDDTAIPYSRRRFDSVKYEVARCMKRVGFLPEQCTYVPVSGLVGDNLAERSSNMPWCEPRSLTLHMLDT